VTRELELDGDRHLGALQRVLERDADLDLDVVATLAALRLLLPPPRLNNRRRVAEVEVREVVRRPPAPKPPGRPFVVPRRSYCLRFSGSESTSYAPCTSLKRSSLPGLRPGALADELAVRLLLISSGLAFFETPSDS